MRPALNRASGAKTDPWYLLATDSYSLTAELRLPASSALRALFIMPRAERPWAPVRPARAEASTCQPVPGLHVNSAASRLVPQTGNATAIQKGSRRRRGKTVG